MKNFGIALLAGIVGYVLLAAMSITWLVNSPPTATTEALRPV